MFLLSKELQVWLFLQPFQHNPTPRSQRPGSTQLIRQPVQMWGHVSTHGGLLACSARRPPPEPPGGSPETLPFASGWARSGRLPPPQPRASPARCREAAAPAGSCPAPPRPPTPAPQEPRAEDSSAVATRADTAAAAAILAHPAPGAAGSAPPTCPTATSARATPLAGALGTPRPCPIQSRPILMAPPLNPAPSHRPPLRPRPFPCRIQSRPILMSPPLSPAPRSLPPIPGAPPLAHLPGPAREDRFGTSHRLCWLFLPASLA